FWYKSPFAFYSLCLGNPSRHHLKPSLSVLSSTTEVPTSPARVVKFKSELSNAIAFTPGGHRLQISVSGKRLESHLLLVDYTSDSVITLVYRLRLYVSTFPGSLRRVIIDMVVLVFMYVSSVIGCLVVINTRPFWCCKHSASQNWRP
ncbi:unnamed protein product, partial [Linum tenue]